MGSERPAQGRDRATLVRSLELLWQGRGPRGRGPKPGLSLERVVTAAITLADREGLGALSMRRVAAELGVGTMSLYRYVPGKAELLNLMLDHVSAPPEPPAESGPPDDRPAAPDAWRGKLEHIGWGTYRLYQDHPWLLQINSSRPLLGPNALLGFNVAVAALAGTGLNGREKVGVIMTLDAYVTGMARHFELLRQANEESDITEEEFWEIQGPAIEAALTGEEFTQVMTLEEDSFADSPEQITEFGLTRVLDGIAAFVAARRAERPESPDADPGAASCR
ncbi:TetR/AcrR family transcriptional regulator [Streptomyces profundus]|uniref:TetR/AcrR family transcriptional regulator n=1 Tax=Streptomyces profundus TaxID=2867410 RepID=UPI001D16E37C|nr:TetR/AcrR family transcriptional regulator [Streptomyces sp. MA3_2.13]